MSDNQPQPYSSGETPMKGDKVVFVESEVDNYVKGTASKIRGRVGTVRNFTYPKAYPLVFFPAEGRKKDFDMGQVQASWLVLVARAESAQ